MDRLELLKQVLLGDMGLMDSLKAIGVLTDEGEGRLKHCEELYNMLFIEETPKDPEAYMVKAEEVADSTRPNLPRCDCCGRPILKTESRWIFDDDRVCKDCLNTYIETAKVKGGKE